MGDTGGAGSGPGGGSGTGPGRIAALFGVPRFRAADAANDIAPLSPVLTDMQAEQADWVSDYIGRVFWIESGTYGYEPARIPESAAAEYVARQLRTRRAAA